jgi:hypothetical protein
MVTQATEYREINTTVKAEDILKHIEKGEDINLTNCHVIGELNTSDAKLETIPNPNLCRLLKQGYNKGELISSGFTEKSSIIKCNITIQNSIFENNVTFSNIIFNNSIDFSETSFNGSVNFSKVNFYDYVSFFKTNFNGTADFTNTYFDKRTYFYFTSFNGPINFSETSFNESLDFISTKISNYTEIKAEEISKQIENGEDISLYNCIIIGDLDVSNIKLKTVQNPFLNLKNTTLRLSEIDEKSSIIESNITIRNSFFLDKVYFSNSVFNGSVDFSKTTFNNDTEFSITIFNKPVYLSDADFNSSADFYYTSFNGTADFSRANFYSSVAFFGTNFNSSVEFLYTNFNDSTYLTGVSFYNSTSFQGANFHSSAHFGYTNFYGPVDFYETNFYSSADFTDANFYHYAYFRETNFYDPVGFKGPNTPENIMVDRKTIELFRKSYENEARYSDADAIYYNYRVYAQRSKSLTSFSKWTDILIQDICGYGLRPLRTLYFSTLIILLFSVIYGGPPCISLSKSENNKTVVKFCWKYPGIYRLSNLTGEQIMISGLDTLYFSIMTFTTVGSGEWYPKDNYRKWVTLEGLLGWVMLGIFMATLSNVMIRS